MGIKKRKYDSYDEYVAHQAEKTNNVELRKSLDATYGMRLGEFRNKFNVLKKNDLLKDGDSVICLGARMGEEVLAFLSIGIDAIGIDIVPYPPLVIECDFNDLPSLGKTYDAAYTNALDHAFDIETFCDNVKSVLNDGGYFFVDASPGAYAKYESLKIDGFRDYIKSISKCGFRYISHFNKTSERGRRRQATLVFVKEPVE